MSHEYTEHSHAHSGARHWAWNVGFAVLFMVVGGVVTLFGEGLLFGKANNEVSIQTFQDWRLICVPADEKGQGGGCAVEEKVGQPDGSVLVSLRISDTTPGAQMEVVVPHGVVLQQGLGFSIGDQPMKVLPYETCVSSGCLVLVGLDNETMKAMRTAATGQVVLAPINGQPVTIPFSLKGFAAAVNALGDAKDRRDSMWSFLGR